MDIEKSFRHTKSITPQQSAAIAEVEEMFVAAAKKIGSSISDSRETSLALTKLQEAKFWAVESIAKNMGD